MHWIVALVYNSLKDTPTTLRELCHCTCMDQQTMSWAAVALVHGGDAIRDRAGRLCRPPANCFSG